MKKSSNHLLLTGVLIVAIMLVVGWYTLSRDTQKTIAQTVTLAPTAIPVVINTPTSFPSPTPQLQFPSGWSQKDMDGYELRLVKESHLSIKPVVNLVRLEKKTDEDPKLFIDKQ